MIHLRSRSQMVSLSSCTCEFVLDVYKVDEQTLQPSTKEFVLKVLFLGRVNKLFDISLQTCNTKLAEPILSILCHTPWADLQDLVSIFWILLYAREQECNAYIWPWIGKSMYFYTMKYFLTSGTCNYMFFFVKNQQSSTTDTIKLFRVSLICSHPSFYLYMI